MKAKEFELISKCIEDGVEYGISRAYKYNESPSRKDLSEEIQRALLNEICEWWHFEDEAEHNPKTGD